MPEQAGAFTLPPREGFSHIGPCVLPRANWAPTAAPTALTWLVCPSPESFTPSPGPGVLLSLQDPPLVPCLKAALGWVGFVLKLGFSIFAAFESANKQPAVLKQYPIHLLDGPVGSNLVLKVHECIAPGAMIITHHLGGQDLPKR